MIPVGRGKTIFFLVVLDTARNGWLLFCRPADLGESTRSDTSLAALRMAGGPQPAVLILLSDGHNFDLIPPGETARRLRARDLPAYTIAYGTIESARDVSIRIAN